MKNLSSILILAAAILLGGCDKFEEINTDPARSSTTLPEYLLANAQKAASDLVYANYYNARIGMELAQYWTGTDKTSEARFLFSNDAFWNGLYAGPLADLQEISNYYADNPTETSDAMLAVSEVMKAWIFHILTDVYGDIPYSEALNGGEITQPVFDTGESVYTALLSSLENQISTLQGATTAIRGDIMAGNDPARWIQIANSLRLRIALRMADVKPSEAQSVIESASAGAISSGDEDVFFPYNEAAETNRFPYNDVDRPLVEFAVTSTLIDFLKETDDPRLPIYARPDETNGEFVGKPFGKEENDPTIIGLSAPGVAAYSGSAPGYLMTFSEVAFIKAEAAERGMNVGGSAEEWYNIGVTAAMQQWGVTDSAGISTYLASMPYSAGEWKDVIGTQKWLALYLQGMQGWLERLRLDFNKPNGEELFIAPLSGSLDPEVTFLPTRLNYPSSTRVNNEANSDAAAARIGGDSQGTKNWWDVN